jgi:hypothetical protein
MLGAERLDGPQLISQGTVWHRPLLLQNSDGRVLLKNSVQEKCSQH